MLSKESSIHVWAMIFFLVFLSLCLRNTTHPFPRSFLPELSMIHSDTRKCQTVACFLNDPALSFLTYLPVLQHRESFCDYLFQQLKSNEGQKLCIFFLKRLNIYTPVPFLLLFISWLIFLLPFASKYGYKSEFWLDKWG